MTWHAAQQREDHRRADIERAHKQENCGEKHPANHEHFSSLHFVAAKNAWRSAEEASLWQDSYGRGASQEKRPVRVVAHLPNRTGISHFRTVRQNPHTAARAIC
jgi:hypothetical protein